MKHLSHTDLKAFIEDFYHYTAGAVSPIAQLYALSAEALIHLLGKAWVQDNVFGLAPIDSILRSRSDILGEQIESLRSFCTVKNGISCQNGPAMRMVKFRPEINQR
jgi:hypothetical protein